MSRKFANILTSIWDDEDFIALEPEAQRTYFMLVTQHNIDACGTLELTMRRWARTVPEHRRGEFRGWIDELADKGFIAFDEDTEELLVRTFAKHDGGYKNANRLAAVRATADAVKTPLLRRLLAIELHKLGIGSPPEPPSDPVLTASQRPSDAVPSESEPGDNGVGTPQVVAEVSSQEPQPLSTTSTGRENPASPPSPYCSKHPEGTEDKCGPCAGARAKRERWDEQRKSAPSKDDLANRRRMQAIAECTVCDDAGFLEHSDGSLERHHPIAKSA